MALLFALAQILVAAHAASPDDMLLHGEATCVACLAGAASPEPGRDAIAFVAPVAGSVEPAPHEAEPSLTVAPTAAHNPRAPPAC